MIRWTVVSVMAIATLAASLLIGRSIVPAQGAKDKQVPPKNDRLPAMPFAVVELFTSEGCSSCPPADEVLADIIKGAELHHQPVFGLSFHVDYWNRLGWRDPYSDGAFSHRQQEYASAFKSDKVYTPQIIVNGNTEFVGSDLARARQEINLALKQRPRAAIKLSQEPGKHTGSVVLSYEVTGAAPGNVLNLAVVERGLVMKVTQGENGGRTLRHENVVRAFESRPLSAVATGTIELKLPADLVRQNSSAIAYVQNTNPRTILGAGAVNLQPADVR